MRRVKALVPMDTLVDPPTNAQRAHREAIRRHDLEAGRQEDGALDRGPAVAVDQTSWKRVAQGDEGDTLSS